MKIVLFGKNGQLGWELQRALAPLGEVIALASDSADYCGDLANLQGIRETLRQLRPQIIVNAAAYTAVDKAESETEQAHLINALAPEAMAQEAASLNAWLVHFSTDYVFSGEGDKPWRESDAVAPLNAYGASKLAGEQAIARHCAQHLIFRTSWVYATRGNNFAKTMLKLGAERQKLAVINDQFGAPTGADLLADCTAHAIRIAVAQPAVAGLYHLAASGCTTWHDYARLVFDEARALGVPLALETLDTVATSAWPTPARRPLNSRLDTDKFCRTFALNLPQWPAGVSRMLNELHALRAI